MLIGRAAQAAELSTLGVTIGDGRSRSALVRGEAGIGKTELLRGVAADAAGRGALAMYGRADDLDRGRPFRLILDLAASIVALDADRAPSSLLESFAGATHQSLDDGEGPTVLGGHSIGDAFVHLVEALALGGPVVLLLDDLQWIDVDSAEVLSRVRAELDDLPIALIGGARPVPLSTRVLDLFAGAPEIVLQPLNQGDIAELAGSIVGAAPGPRLLAELERAGGNPFFAMELLDALRQHGRLLFGGGQVDLSDFALPDELRLTVLSRLEGYPEEVAAVLRRATVLGSEFSVIELEHLVGRKRLRSILGDAVAAGLLDPVGDGGRRYAFRHDLMRAALYDDLGPHEQPGLHRRAAEVLAGLGAPSSRVAAHLLLVPAPVDASLLDLFERTAWALRRSSASASLELSERCLRLLAASDPRHARLRAGMVEPMVYLGRLVDAEETARAVLAEDPAMDRDLRQELLFSLYIAVNRQDGAATAIADLEAALVGPDLRVFDEAMLRACLAHSLIQQGNMPDALLHAEFTLDAGNQLDDARLQVAAWLALAFIASARGEVAAASEYGRLADEHQHREGMPFSADLYHGIVQLEADELDAAAVTLNTGRQRARERGELSSQTTYDWALAGRHYIAGEWDDCLTEAEGGYARMATGVGMRQAVLIGRAMTTRILVHRGDLDAAEAEAERGTIELAGGALAGGDALLWARAMLLEQRGDPLAALALLEMEYLMTASTRYHLSWRLVFPDTVRLARAAGRDDLVEQVLLVADEGARAGGSLASPRACALLCRGLARDDVDLLLQATAAYRRSPRVVELARGAAAAGAALARAGRDVEARGLLREGAAIFRGVGAATDLGPVDALLRRLDGDVPTAGPRPTSGWESLTRSELRIIELVAEGRTSPQIAEALFLSTNTVSTHLKHVFAKLGMSSRSEVAAEVVRRRERSSARSS